jgi:hypothetical protein
MIGKCCHCRLKRVRQATFSFTLLFLAQVTFSPGILEFPLSPFAAQAAPPSLLFDPPSFDILPFFNMHYINLALALSAAVLVSAHPAKVKKNPICGNNDKNRPGLTAGGPGGLYWMSNEPNGNFIFTANIDAEGTTVRLGGKSNRGNYH